MLFASAQDGGAIDLDIAVIVSTPGLSVVLVDENQTIMSWNGAAADLFGVPAAQAMGQPVADVAGRPRTVTGLGRENLASVIAARKERGRARCCASGGTARSS